MKVHRLLALTAVVLAACQPASESWSVHGQVMGKSSGLPVANQTLVVMRFHRDPWWCPFCDITSTKVATISTDAAGRYAFTSNRSGMYGISGISQINSSCSASAALGSMSGGKHRVDLVMQEKNCYLEY